MLSVRMIAGWGVAAAVCAAGAQTEDTAAADIEQRHRDGVGELLAAYCFECHGDQEKVKGGVRLAGLADMGAILERADDLAMARELIATGEMPPADEPAPDEHERLLLLQWLDDALAYRPPDSAVDPGWFTIHRLNRVEYENTLSDLLGIDARGFGEDLPPDDTGYGFDNIADVLTVSSLHLEEYLDAAEAALTAALGEPAPDEPRIEHIRLGEPRAGNQLPTGGYFLYANGTTSGRYHAPSSGEYEIVVRAWGTPGGDEHPNLRVVVDGDTAGDFGVGALRGDPSEHRVRVRLEAGAHQIGGAFTNDFWKKDVADRNLAVESVSVRGPIAGTAARSVAWERVFQGHAPGGDEAASARAILAQFASRAFRRPANDREIEGLCGVFAESRGAGDSFERAVQTALSAVLVSPAFLYRAVGNPAPDDTGSVYRLNDYELASRLSYFLWSTMPDTELRDASDLGMLTDGFGESELRAQAKRMLADERTDVFIDNFVGQWMLLRNLDSLDIDRARFPEYDESLRADMIREVRMLFADVVRSDRSVLELLDADYTFVNARLAKHYGLDGVEGDRFRRVSLGEGSRRGGLLRTGAVLTVTSHPTRTSPVKRGLFVLDEFLGTPPPPPPPDIPRLEEAAAHVGDDASLREQLKAHLTNPTCAVCHNRMDPIGLGLENYDAIGRWRDSYGQAPIDPSGELPGGVRFDGPEGLQKVLVGRESQFVETLVSKVLTYALGRGLEPFDRPTVQKIVDHVRANGDRFDALIEGIALSEAFRTCRGREP